MRVLHVIPSVSAVHGGPTQALMTIERGLCAAGASVTTATTDDDGPGHRLKPGSQPREAQGATRIYCRKWIDFYIVAPGMVPLLWRNVRRFDVVHIHALFSFASVAAALVAAMRRVPYIVRPLGTLTRYGVTQRRPSLKRLSLALLESRILRNAAAVHFTSEAELDEAKVLGVSLRGVVIPLAIEAGSKGDPRILHNEYPALATRRVVLYLSRLDPKKNVEGLLDAFAMLRKRHSDLALLVAGDGPPLYVDALKARAEELGIAPDVIWLGRVAGARKASAFAAANLFALPSLSENFGLAAAEAMRCGLACVLGRGVAIAQAASAAGAALTVDPQPEPIAQAMEQLLANKAERDAMGLRAREFAEREFSVEVMAERLTALYRDAIDGARFSSSIDR